MKTPLYGVLIKLTHCFSVSPICLRNRIISCCTYLFSTRRQGTYCNDKSRFCTVLLNIRPKRFYHHLFNFCFIPLTLNKNSWWSRLFILFQPNSCINSVINFNIISLFFKEFTCESFKFPPINISN